MFGGRNDHWNIFRKTLSNYLGQAVIKLLNGFRNVIGEHVQRITGNATHGNEEDHDCLYVSDQIAPHGWIECSIFDSLNQIGVNLIAANREGLITVDEIQR